MSEGQRKNKPTVGRVLTTLLFSFAGFLVVAGLLYASAFGPTEQYAQKEQFLVTPDKSVQQIADALTQKGFVRASVVFQLAYLREGAGVKIRPGGYEISKSMDAWTIASQLLERPYVAWITVPVGVRKEQIRTLLADELGWSDAQKAAWDSATASTSPNYIEGVYFPDIYLIPTDQTPDIIAGRMRDNFKQHFAPYADEALKEGVSWTRVLTIASLIQREAGSVSDMSIISGVIQKRLAAGMPLAIDATLQYMNGSEETGWWTAPNAAGTYPDSPFNTYKRKGLPPHPIAEPGLAAISAALHPATTNCLFYLHDAKGQIHCSPTYKGQLANVQKYLK